MIQKPRGTIDILPADTPLWQFIEAKIRKVAALYGYDEIRIPTFEMSELYKRGVGDSTDVVQKEMYTFEDNDSKSITLRPEGTAGVVRSVIENGLLGDALPLPVYYLISCFRYEKPEAGRSREFYQFGAELFGADDAAADANVISFCKSIFDELSIDDISLEINSIGCSHCRPKYHKALKEYFGAHTESLCETCRGRLETNPLRILDCKSPVCSEIAAGAPKTIDFLCPDCAGHFDELKGYLDASGIGYKINPKIVRGLDYYKKTVFEFVSSSIGSQSTVCGGGRYDGLVGELDGPDISGIGFAMGLTRIVLALKAKKDSAPAAAQAPDIYIASLGAQARKTAFALCRRLITLGASALFDQMGRSLKAQMKYADKKSARFVLILGDNEVASGRAVLKNMADGTQTEVSIADAAGLAELLSK